MARVDRKGMGGHQSAAINTDVWLTPRFILDALGPFDFDPCAAPDPLAWPTAAKHVTLPDNGLLTPWEGRVWCNPPYGRETIHWMRKLADHGRGTALIFARTETEMFFETVWRRASAVLFIEGRLYFHHANGDRADANAGAPSCLVAYGEDDAVALVQSSIAGYTVLL